MGCDLNTKKDHDKTGHLVVLSFLCHSNMTMRACPVYKKQKNDDDRSYSPARKCAKTSD